MKRILRLLCLLLVLILCAGCGETEKEPDKPDDPQPQPQSKYDISGKTYFKTYDKYGNAEHSNVAFNSDGTFVFRDQYYDGMNIMSGTWTLAESGAITLNVEKTGVGAYTKISMTVSEDDAITLGDSISGSNEGDIFVAEDRITEYAEKVNGFKFGKYENMENECYLIFNENGTFELTEAEGFGATLVEGNWGREGDVLMFSNFEPFNDYAYEKIYNFEFRIKDMTSLSLMTDLEFSKDGDMYVHESELAVYKESKAGAELEFGTFEDRDGQSFMKLNADGTYEFSEVEGLGAVMYEGKWTREGDTLKCVNNEAVMNDGVSIKAFEFTIKNGRTLVLMSEFPSIPILIVEHEFLFSK